MQLSLAHSSPKSPITKDAMCRQPLNIEQFEQPQQIASDAMPKLSRIWRRGAFPFADVALFWRTLSVAAFFNSAINCRRSVINPIDRIFDWCALILRHQIDIDSDQRNFVLRSKKPICFSWGTIVRDPLSCKFHSNCFQPVFNRIGQCLTGRLSEHYERKNCQHKRHHEISHFHSDSPSVPIKDEFPLNSRKPGDFASPVHHREIFPWAFLSERLIGNRHLTPAST